MLKNTISRKPIRMWIDGKCFNIKPFNKKISGKELSSDSKIDEKQTENEFKISNENGMYQTNFELPCYYYSEIKKNTSFNIENLSNDTNTKIIVPNNGKICIQGEHECNVKDASEELLSVIGHIRKMCRPSQFISIPIVSKEVQENFQRFKEEILSGDSIEGVVDSIFQSHLKLHLTIAVLSLLNDLEKKEAIKALEEYKTNFKHFLKNDEPLRIKVSGIHCMTGDIKRAHVLYANAEIINNTEENYLQNIANDISEYFYEKGFLDTHVENVKLHVTLINTKYRKPSSPSPKKKRWAKRESIDATYILEKYKDFVFGECNFESIHLSHISSIGDDGFYKPLGIIKFD